MTQPQIFVIGISHHSSSVSSRECLRFNTQEQYSLVTQLIASSAISEAGILCTCNRTEIYIISSDIQQAQRKVGSLIANLRGKKGEEVLESGYFSQGKEALRHLFRVAAGLHSQILGENEILGQIKHSYEIAIETNGAGPYLHRVFNLALQTGKRVRSETRISEGIVSSGSAAADFLFGLRGNNIFNNRVVVVGSGPMAKMAVKQLKKRNLPDKQIALTSRTLCHAYQMATSLGISCFPIQALPVVLTKTDSLIAATGADSYVLWPEHFEKRLSLDDNKENFVCLDLGVPRNIAPEIENLPGVALHNIDDFNDVTTTTLRLRHKEIPPAELIIEESIEEFQNWYHSRRVAPIIKDLHHYVEMICQEEVERYGNTFHTDDKKKLSKFSQSLAKKIIKGPIQQLQLAASDNDETSLATLKQFFEFTNDAQNSTLLN